MAFGGPPKPGGSGRFFAAWLVFCAVMWAVLSIVNHVTG